MVSLKLSGLLNDIQAHVTEIPVNFSQLAVDRNCIAVELLSRCCFLEFSKGHLIVLA
jgi:hypothetical protein